MSQYIIPANPSFTTTMTECESTDFVVDTHFNRFIENLFVNDNYLKKKEEAFESSVASQLTALETSIMSQVNIALTEMRTQIEAGEVDVCDPADITWVLS